MEEKGMKKYIYYPLRALSMALFILVIRQVTNSRFLTVMGDPLQGSQIHHVVFYCFAIVTSILITNSVVSLFTVYDKRALWAYLDKKHEEVYFPRDIAEILKDKDFYIETVPHMLMTAGLVCLDLYGEFTYVLSFIKIVKRGVLGYFIVALICAVIVFAVSLLARYEARRYWAYLKNRRALDKLSKKLPLILRAYLILAIYPIAAPYMPYLIFMLLTIFGLVATLADMLTALGLILTVGAIVAISKLYKNIRYYLKKKRTIREIAATAKAKGYEVRLYDEEQVDTEGCNLVISREGERYSIRFIKPRRRSTPLYFTERYAYYLYKIGTKNHYRSLESRFDYTFDAEGEKILLLTEIPKHLFVKEDERQRRINAGDRIWGYIIYEPRSLVGNLDRDCLDRANNDRR